jgi:holin-like protein
MLAAFTLILVCQIAGEALVRGAGLPLPGPVIGMLLLFLLMRLRLPLPPELNDAADVLLKYLALLFVPAGVGAVQHLDRLGSEGVRLGAVILLSTVISLTVTALIFAGLAHVLSADEPASKDNGEAP